MNKPYNSPPRHLGEPKGRGKRPAATTRSNLLTGILGACLYLITAPAQAMLIHDLSINELLNFSGSGQIAFSSDTGNSSAGVSAFSFSGTGAQGSYSFSLGDIANITWSIDAVTSALTLDLETNAILSAPGVETCLILQNNNDGYGTCGGILWSHNSYSRIAQQKVGRTTTGIGSLLTTPVQTIPEPMPLALLAAGLLVMGATRRKGRR